MLTTTQPPRPDEADPHRRPERRWLPATATLAVLVFVVGGARFVADAVAGPPGAPVVIDGVGSVQPAAGWMEARRDDGGSFHSVLLRRGTAGLFVMGIDGYEGSIQALADEYTEQVLREEFARLHLGDREEVVLRSGIPAVRFGYIGVTPNDVTIEGVVTAVVGARGGIAFDGFAPAGDLAWVVDDLRTMIDTAAVL